MKKYSNGGKYIANANSGRFMKPVTVPLKESLAEKKILLFGLMAAGKMVTALALSRAEGEGHRKT